MEKSLVMINFSFSHSVFKKPVLENVGKNARGKNVIGKNIGGKIARGKNVRSKVVKIP